MLPSSIVTRIENELFQAGFRVKLQSANSVGGGCIHQACRLETSNGSFFLKWNTVPHAPIFTLEAAGLNTIRTTKTVAVPQVYAASDPAPGSPGFILLEWIEPQRGNYDPVMLGEQLSAMHFTSESIRYGLDHDNLIGSSPQINTWEVDWITFFRDHRLIFQFNLAKHNGHLTPWRQARAEKILEKLPALLGGAERKPSLLHGDLWSGNVICGPKAHPFLVDPAIYYGDREAEIAFTELFGGFTPRFYQAYHSAYPLDPGYRERRDLYNLYHLLNHLNIFGASYGAQVDSILRRYAGG